MPEILKKIEQKDTIFLKILIDKFNTISNLEKQPFLKMLQYGETHDDIFSYLDYTHNTYTFDDLIEFELNPSELFDNFKNLMNNNDFKTEYLEMCQDYLFTNMTNLSIVDIIFGTHVSAFHIKNKLDLNIKKKFFVIIAKFDNNKYLPKFIMAS